MYAGDLGGRDIKLTGETSFIEISMTRDPFYDLPDMHVRATVNPATLEWETGTAAMPVDPEALLALARQHRAEYDELRERLAILRALKG